MKRPIRRILITLCGAAVVMVIAAYLFASEIGAYILVHPFRRTISGGMPAGHEIVTF